MIQRYTTLSGDSIISDSDGEYVSYDDMIDVFKELSSKGLLDKEAYQVILNALAGEKDA